MILCCLAAINLFQLVLSNTLRIDLPSGSPCEDLTLLSQLEENSCSHTSMQRGLLGPTPRHAPPRPTRGRGVAGGVGSVWVWHFFVIFRYRRISSHIVAFIFLKIKENHPRRLNLVYFGTFSLFFDIVGYRCLTLVFAKTWPEFSVSYHSKKCDCTIVYI